MKRFILIALGTLVSTAAFAQPSAPPPGSSPCLRQVDIYSFNPVPGNRSLIVEDRAHKRYRVNFNGICTGLQFNLGVAFKTRGVGTLACLSRGDSILRRDPVGPRECFVQGVEWQTPALDKADAQAKAAKP